VWTPGRPGAAGLSDGGRPGTPLAPLAHPAFKFNLQLRVGPSGSAYWYHRGPPSESRWAPRREGAGRVGPPKHAPKGRGVGP
jgi:hypothetical protein